LAMRKIKQKIDVADLLQNAGLRSTRQRLTLGTLLFDGVDKHVTAEQMFDAARKTRAHVSLATVYNTLHQFTEAGLLREVVIDASRVYFDTNTGDHHHFFDEASGHLTDVPAESVHVGRLPKLPVGKSLDRVDVIIRVRSKS
jgi:Fur family transcriptional regulator, iron response regulator